MDWKHYSLLLSQGRFMGVKHVVISGGGEPFCRKSLTKKIMNKVKESHMTGTIVTNATLLTEQDYKFMMDIRWDDIVMSLSGLKEFHDRLTGFKSFDRIIDAIGFLEGKVNVIISIIIMENNLTEIPSLLNELERFKKIHIDFKPVIPYNNIKKVTKSRLPLLKKILGDVKQNSNAKIMLDNLDLFYLDDMRKATKKCFVPFDKISIRPDGTIRSCVYSDDFAGNVKENDLDEIWQSETFVKVREALSKKSFFDYCKNCNALEVIENNRKFNSQIRS